MLDRLKRKILFAKLVRILEGLRRRLSGEKTTSGDEKVLGWTVNQQWKTWLEGGAILALGGALGASLDKLTAYAECLQHVPPISCTMNFPQLGVAAAIGAISALLGWLRMSPKDPRRGQ